MKRDEFGLTLKQRKFADLYLQYGNKTKAAIEAGYSERSASAIADETLGNPKIVAYLEHFQKNVDNERIAGIEEVMQFYSDVMRGRVKDQFGLDASLADRLKAGDSLAKRYASVGKGYGKRKKQVDDLTRSLLEDAERMERERTGDDCAK